MDWVELLTNLRNRERGLDTRVLLLKNNLEKRCRKW